MVRLLIAFLCALSLYADCVVWAPLPAGTACVAEHPGIYWTSKYPSAMPIPGLNLQMDPTLADPAFQAGIDANGVQRFFFALPGEYILELFLYFADSETDSWVMEVSDKPVDARFTASPLRLGPANPPRVVSLIGAVRGGEDITIRSNSPGYAVIGARWTPRGTFEIERVPQILERLRKLQADPFFENRLSSRADRMVELAELAMRSRNLAASNEALLQLTRATYWIAAHSQQPRDTRRLVELFDEAATRIPNHPAIRQMISAVCAGTAPGLVDLPRGRWCATTQPVLWSAPVDVKLEGAPAWATAQWQLRTRLESLTTWWVRQRQRDNGELGGGWHNDVELLHQWGQLALGFGSQTALDGIRRLADGVWKSGQLDHGYDRMIADVGHSSLLSSLTAPLLVALSPSDPTARANLAEAAACAHFWIVPQPDGAWRFRSSWFNCREYDPRPERAVDSYLNTSALGPAFWQTSLTRDPKLIELLARYGESWRKAQLDTSHGKPAGLFPPVLRSADGDYLIDSKGWDKPQAEWEYFQQSGRSQVVLTSLMRALHDLTSDPKWLDAVQRQAPPNEGPTAILSDLTAASVALDARLSTNFGLYTTEAIYTDRVSFELPPEYAQRLFGGDTPRGDCAPSFNITWPATDTRFARVVLTAGNQALTARLYSFEDAPATVPLRLWRLDPGTYQWEAAQQKGTFEVHVSPVDLAVRIQPRAETELRIMRQF